MKKPKAPKLSPKLSKLHAKVKRMCPFGGAIQKLEFTHVVWDDSVSLGGNTWAPMGSVITEATIPAYINSCGILLDDTPTYIVLAQSVHSGNVGQCLKIPKSAIKYMDIIGTSIGLMPNFESVDR